MEKYDVIFNCAGDEWQVEMTADAVGILAKHRPIIDGRGGAKAFVIHEFRFDVDNGKFMFYLVELK